MDVSSAKAKLRTQALLRRAALGESERRLRSAHAVRHIEKLLRRGETVALFWPIRDEIDPRPLLPLIAAQDGTAALPAIVDHRLVFRHFLDEESLEAGTFGTRHPSPHHGEATPDLIVAPLAAFDRAGGRIGYGRGYYDTAVAELRARGHVPRLVGLAFSCQEVDIVPMEDHDIPLPLIATEDELIDTTAKPTEAL
ncbi:5-formyltetrahydrofolate cyclo-ligase [Rhodopseudomonas julia]|uniref:5-formyltetrahydrofolate cyclo-ligase n=1 Tax=Rhodopseudomonas julia TaxID=200617 RepID=A0ABU0C692_9BRAD|nr:5-formyltetrahydrofolate cyclo-ligase [Rhodopseudomonas julia]MDQ0326043.1 5-formyltetrahydrofolate cyclo-ligase [Rhodopseudomonas julia]